MSNNCAQGALSRFWVKDGAGGVADSFSWSTGTVTSYEFLAESLAKIGTIVHPNGIRGTRSRTSERARLGPYRVMGTILMNIDPLMLKTNWLSRILGGTESTNVWELTENLSPFGVFFDRVTQTFQYYDVYVNRWILRGQANQYGSEPQPLQLALELVGKTQGMAVAVPAVDLATTSNTAVYIHEDAILTLNSIARPLIAFEFQGNNFLQVRFTNSLTATDICAQDREISLNMTLPFTSDTLALLDLTIAGITGTLVFTNSTISKSLTFTLRNVKIPTRDPNVRGKNEIVMNLQADIYKISTTNEIQVTSTS